MHFSALALLFQNESSGPNAAAIGAFLAANAIVFAIILVITIIIYWRIASKAGYPGAYSLLMLVPLVNLIIILLFAFTEWPIEREVRALRGPIGRTPIGTV